MKIYIFRKGEKIDFYPNAEKKYPYERVFIIPPDIRKCFKLNPKFLK